MSQAEEVWRRKSDGQVVEAMKDLGAYTVEGRAVIQAEFARRGLTTDAESHPRCPKCGIAIGLRADFEKCGSCGEVFSEPFCAQLEAWAGVDNEDEDQAVVDDEARTVESVTAAPETTGVSARRGAGNFVVGRYRDAYHEAAVLVTLGGIVKVVGIVVGVLIALVSLGASDRVGGAGAFFGGVVLGAFVAFGVYVAGISISARGQVLRAMLDTAVSSSPFMNDGERADAMGLPKSAKGRKGTRSC